MAIVEFEGDSPRSIDCHCIALRIRVQRMSFVAWTGQVRQDFCFVDHFQYRRAASAKLGRDYGAATRFEKFLEYLVAKALDHGWYERNAICDILSILARQVPASIIEVRVFTQLALDRACLFEFRDELFSLTAARLTCYVIRYGQHPGIFHARSTLPSSIR